MSTKVHAVTDGLGNPLHFILSSGNRNDICAARELLEPFDLHGKLILADKGYDSDRFVKWVEERGGIVVIPSRVLQSIHVKLTIVFITNVTWSKTCSLNSRIIAVSPPVMRKPPWLFRL